MSSSSAIGAAQSNQVLPHVYTGDLYSDYQIVCNDETFNVHKVILHSRSEWFGRKLPDALKVTDPNAGFNAKTLTLNEEDAATLGVMIEFFYTSSYDVPKPPSALSFHFQVLRMGGKYECEALENYAFQKLSAECEGNTWSCSDLVSMAGELYEVRNLRNFDRLSRLTVRVMGDHLSEFLKSVEFVQFLEKMPDWSLRILHNPSGRPSDLTEEAMTKLAPTRGLAKAWSARQSIRGRSEASKAFGGRAQTHPRPRRNP